MKKENYKIVTPNGIEIPFSLEVDQNTGVYPYGVGDKFKELTGVDFDSNVSSKGYKCLYIGREEQ